MSLSMNDALSFVRDAARQIPRDEVDAAILIVLMTQGFSTEPDGLEYLRQAIFLRYQKRHLRLTEIYTEIAENHPSGLNASQVEQGIRASIEAAWKNGNMEALHVCFPEDEKPTNGKFISTMANIIYLWTKCFHDDSRHNKMR